MFKSLKNHPIFAIIGAIAAIAGIVFGILALIKPEYALVTSGEKCGWAEEVVTEQVHQWNECENPNKVTGYQFTEQVSQSSGWVGGGKDQNWHCTNVKRAKERAVGQSIVWSNKKSGMCQ